MAGSSSVYTALCQLRYNTHPCSSRVIGYLLFFVLSGFYSSLSLLWLTIGPRHTPHGNADCVSVGFYWRLRSHFYVSLGDMSDCDLCAVTPYHNQLFCLYLFSFLCAVVDLLVMCYVDHGDFSHLFFSYVIISLPWGFWMGWKHKAGVLCRLG